jgi:hypothetical protein
MMTGSRSATLQPPTEVEALDYLLHHLRGANSSTFGSDRYDILLPRAAENYVYEKYPPPAGLNPQDWINQASEKIFGPFVAAAWSLCRLGVIHPGPKYLDPFGNPIRVPQ